MFLDALGYDPDFEEASSKQQKNLLLEQHNGYKNILINPKKYPTQ